MINKLPLPKGYTMLLLYIVCLICTFVVQADTNMQLIIAPEKKNTLATNELLSLNADDQIIENCIQTNTASKITIKRDEKETQKNKHIPLAATEKKPLKKESSNIIPDKPISKNKAIIQTQKKDIIIENVNNADNDPNALQKITVINCITPEKTGYTYWSTTYQPEFTVTVDGKQVEIDSQKSIEVDKKTVSISYNAKFPANYSSEGSVAIEIAKNTKKIFLDFDWKSEPRLQVRQSS